MKHVNVLHQTNRLDKKIADIDEERLKRRESGRGRNKGIVTSRNIPSHTGQKSPGAEQDTNGGTATEHPSSPIAERGHLMDCKKNVDVVAEQRNHSVLLLFQFKVFDLHVR